MKKILLSIAIVVTVIIGAGYGCWRYTFPYGWSHSCDKQVMFALHCYADAHGGWYPRGEESPEASLSLLYPDLGAEPLRGKTVPSNVVDERLKQGLRLTPETCGWHYVEGLRSDDDSNLALFWDKIGLGHNGERLPKGDHTVFFVNGIHEYISGDEWEAFIADQEKLRKAIDRTKPKTPPPQKGK